MHTILFSTLLPAAVILYIYIYISIFNSILFNSIYIYICIISVHCSEEHTACKVTTNMCTVIYDLVEIYLVQHAMLADDWMIGRSGRGSDRKT